MEFRHSYPFVTFVVLTVDQIVGRDEGPLQPQRQDSQDRTKTLNQEGFGRKEIQAFIN